MLKRLGRDEHPSLLSDGEKNVFLYHRRQIIRLKVPFNIDPVVYATEYLQQALNDEGLP